MIPRPKKPPRPAGDNPLLRRAFDRDLRSDVFADPDFLSDAHPSRQSRVYREWLRHHGINPDTGAMTAAGIAFFTTLIEEQNARNRQRRAHRQASASMANVRHQQKRSIFRGFSGA
jgi:hypothetical protein